jgi:hypothetical protein
MTILATKVDNGYRLRLERPSWCGELVSQIVHGWWTFSLLEGKEETGTHCLEQRAAALEALDPAQPSVLCRAFRRIEEF